MLLKVLLAVLLSTNAEAGLFDSKKQFTDEDNHVVARLIESFGPGCSLTGGIASDAISVVRSLGDVMKAAAADANCSSLAGVVSHLQAAHTNATGIWPKANDDAFSRAQTDYLKYKKQKEEILLLLASESDSEVRKELQSQLRQVQIEMAGVSGESVLALESDRQVRKREAVKFLVTATNLAMEQALANQNCWASKPDLLQQMVGLGSSVGYSAAMVAPTSGVALAMGSGLQLVGGFIDFIKNLATKRKVNSFAKALDPIALTCALEKMNQIYCSAKDTQATLDVLAKAGTGVTSDPLWQGVRINSRELPIFISWLEKLRTGSGSVGSPDDAERIAYIEQQKLRLEQSLRYLQGYLAKYRPLFYQMTDDEGKFSVLKDFISAVGNTFCPNMQGSVSNHPLCSVYSSDFVPFYLLGLTREQVLSLSRVYPNISFSQVDLALLVSSSIVIDINIDKVEPRFMQWHRLANEKLQAEASTIVGDDLRLVFEKAFPKGGADKLNVSPYTALVKIIQFLEVAPELTTSFSAEILQTLREVAQEMNSVQQGLQTPEQARMAIYSKASLNAGTSFLSNRIQFSLRQKLESLLLSQQNIPIQVFAANDYLLELFSYYGTDSLEVLRRKAMNAQATMQRSIDPFMEFFGAQLQESLYSFDRLSKKFKEGPGGPNYEMKTTLCFYLLASGSWYAKMDLSPCLGVQGKPVFANGYSTPVFSKKLFENPYSDRACVLRDYVRRNKVLQAKWGFKGRVQLPPALRDSFEQGVGNK